MKYIGFRINAIVVGVMLTLTIFAPTVISGLDVDKLLL